MGTECLKQLVSQGPSSTMDILLVLSCLPHPFIQFPSQPGNGATHSGLVLPPHSPHLDNLRVPFPRVILGFVRLALIIPNHPSDEFVVK